MTSEKYYACHVLIIDIHPTHGTILISNIQLVHGNIEAFMESGTIDQMLPLHEAFTYHHIYSNTNYNFVLA